MLRLFIFKIPEYILRGNFMENCNLCLGKLTSSSPIFNLDLKARVLNPVSTISFHFGDGKWIEDNLIEIDK